MLVKGYRRVLLFLIPGQAVHGFQRVPEARDGADEAQCQSGPDHPASPAKSIPQPDRQQHKAGEGKGDGESKLARI